MRHDVVRSAVLSLLGALAFAACSGGASTPATGTTAPSTAAPAGFPGWPVGPDPDAQFVPLLVSSELAVGSNRFLYSLTDLSNKVLASPDLATSVRVYDLAADPAKPVAEAPGIFIWTVPDQLGLYHATVDLGRAGPWGFEITAALPGQPGATARVIVDVRERSTTPVIGASAPDSITPTATTTEGIAAISSDPHPDPDFYRSSVADALASKRPFVLTFATPLFCKSASCGPTLDTVKSVAPPYKDRVDFIHVEPYQLQQVGGALQPVDDGYGRFVVGATATAWGIPTEPFTFVVGADGTVAAKFEGALGADELRQAIESVAGP